MLEEQESAEQYQRAAERVDALVGELNGLPYPRVREQVLDLLQNVDALHRAALGRLVGLLAGSGHAGLVEQLATDEVVRSLLCLYDLYPEEPCRQVETALADVRSILAARGGELEVLGVEDGVVRLRLSGSACHDCAAAQAALENALTQTLREGFPGFRSIQLATSEYR
jgi:Fe-S cluster biogenesis protein NfuA